jgi:hypothetical protein
VSVGPINFENRSGAHARPLAARGHQKHGGVAVAKPIECRLRNELWIAQPPVEPARGIPAGVAAPDGEGEPLGDDNGLVALPIAAEKWLACARDGALAGWGGVS